MSRLLLFPAMNAGDLRAEKRPAKLVSSTATRQTRNRLLAMVPLPATKSTNIPT